MSTVSNYRFVWMNFLFLTLSPLVCLIGVPLFIIYQDVSFSTVLATLVLMILTGLGITMGYHRLFSHRTYNANKILETILLFFGGISFQNSALYWSAAHRRHHQHTDSDQDPYNAKRGFWYSHILWIFWEKTHDYDLSNVSDLKENPRVMFQHKYYLPYSIAGNLLMIALSNLFIQNWTASILFPGFLRLVLNHHFTFFINSLAHIVGTQPYSNRDTARDNFLLALVTYGEGYHNFHHRFPNDYRNGIRWYHFDPSKWLIKSLSKINWTWNLRNTPPEIILQAKKSQLQEKIIPLYEKIQRKWPKQSAELREKLAKAEERLETALKNLHSLRVKAIKKSDSTKDMIKSWKRSMARERKNAEAAFKEWAQISGQFFKMAYAL